MDRTESHVEGYLRHRFGDAGAIVYEPDGGIPPDFSVRGEIAIEARRLNKHIVHEGVTEAIEAKEFPILDFMLATLRSSGPPDSRGSWFVGWDYTRPLPPWRALKRSITNQLNQWRNNRELEPDTVVVAKSFQMDIIRASKRFETLFVPGAYSDLDSGGWVVSDMKQNIDICVAEKTQKIAPYLTRYKEWWLVLVDNIGWGLHDEIDRARLREILGVSQPWTKIIVVDPRDCTFAFEI